MQRTDSSTATIDRIRALCQQHDAVILAHNYQLGEIQDLADYAGDSLDLSRRAAETDAKVIVFCGVDFMAETAAILCPDKTVLLPVTTATCPMAHMVDAASLRELKAEHPEAAVVCYVNSTAAVKAESDVCCTSANAVAVVSSFPADRPIIFVPDRYLGQHVQRLTGRELILWQGFCPTHARIRGADIERLVALIPGAEVLAHPECRPEVAERSHAVLSTAGICARAAESDAQDFIVATEMGIIHRLRQENPTKRFHAVSEQAVCPTMKLIRLEDVARSLERLEHRVVVPEATRAKAARSLERMLAVG